jgi:hypothetical protein
MLVSSDQASLAQAVAGYGRGSKSMRLPLTTKDSNIAYEEHLKFAADTSFYGWVAGFVRNRPAVKVAFDSMRCNTPVSYETSYGVNGPVSYETSYGVNGPVSHETSYGVNGPVSYETSYGVNAPVSYETSYGVNGPVSYETSYNRAKKCRVDRGRRRSYDLESKVDP